MKITPTALKPSIFSALVVLLVAHPAPGFSATGMTLQQAVQTAVKNSSQIIIQNVQVELAKANEQEAGGPFDPTLSSSAAYQAVRGYDYPNALEKFGTAASITTFMAEDKDNTELKAGLSKLFRNGLYTDFSVSLQSSTDHVANQNLTWNVLPNLPALVPGANNQLSTYSPAYPSVIQFLINVPLMKMRGEFNLPAANESSKRYERLAAEATLKHAIATIIQDVVNSYWSYKASLVRLQYAKASQQQVQNWVDNLEQQKAKTDIRRELAHLRGFLNQRAVDVSNANNAVNIARNKLAQSIGIASGDTGTIGQAQDTYPLDWSAVLNAFNEDVVRKRWTELAMENRFDLKAASLKLDAASTIHLGAQNDEMPKLDLAIILQQQGLSAGSGGRVDSLHEGTSDLGYTVLLSYSKPLGNNKAKSLVTKTHYGKLQAQVQYGEAQRQVGLDVDSAVGTVKNSLTGLLAAKNQTEHYVSALETLTKDNDIDADKVFDLVVIETARLDAFNNHINALLSVANALTAARFQTGTLLKESDNVQEIAINELSKLP